MLSFHTTIYSCGLGSVRVGNSLTFYVRYGGATPPQSTMKKCKKCGSKNIISIEYFYSKNIPDEHLYDGISEFRCQDCGFRIGRWSGRELKGDDYERRYGL